MGLRYLTNEQAEEIRQSTEPHKVLAERFGVHKTAISHIKCNRTYKRHHRPHMAGLVSLPSFPNYAITRDGRVWSDKRGRWMSSHISNRGYIITGLTKNGKMKVVNIHQLLLDAFVGPCPEGMEGLHLDNNKLNNDLGNLKYGTHLENVQGEANGNTFLTADIVRQILADYATGMRQCDIVRKYGLRQVHINNIVNRKIWKHIA